jgi:predicted metal-binding membrane protein
VSVRAEQPRSLPRIDPILVAAGLLGLALVAWIVTIERMEGMDGGPGTDLGGLGWYVGVWVTMMAAMMLPSAAPMVLLFSKVSRDRARRGRAFVPTWVFVAGYLAAWTVYGLAAYGLYRLIVAADFGFLDWGEQGPVVAGLVLVAAGLYELTPLKSVCLKHCRTPLHFLLHGWREGWLGAFRMGVEHGAFCIGCCFGLMLILFALGVMSILWMAILAAIIFLQKVLPFGRWLTWALAVAFVASGIWVAAAPASVPGLVDPSTAPAMQMGGDDSMGNGKMKDDQPMQKSGSMTEEGGSMTEEGGSMSDEPMSSGMNR